jgi:hypothetical protein
MPPTAMCSARHVPELNAHARMHVRTTCEIERLSIHAFAHVYRARLYSSAVTAILVYSYMQYMKKKEA